MLIVRSSYDITILGVYTVSDNGTQKGLRESYSLGSGASSG